MFLVARKIVGVSLAVACCFSLSACSSIGGAVSNFFGGKDNAPQAVSAPQAPNNTSISVQNSLRVDAGKYAAFSPSYVDEQITAVGENGEVLQKRANEGVLKYSFGEELASGLAADSALIVAVSKKAILLALDVKTQKLAWKTQLSAPVLAAPVLSANKVLVLTVDGAVNAFDRASGAPLWQVQGTPVALRVYAASGMTLDGEILFANAAGGKIRAINTVDGALLWENTVAMSKGATEIDRLNDVVGRPLVESGRVCAASFQGRVACFSQKDGSLLWAKELSSVNSLAANASLIFATDVIGTVSAFNKENGQRVWEYKDLLARQVSAPAVLADFVLVGDYEGFVYFLDATTGKLNSRLSLDGSAVQPDLQSDANHVVIQTTAGQVVQLRLK